MNFTKNRHVVTLRIGAPIKVKEQDEFNNLDKFGRYLRSKVYCLSSPLEVKKFYFPGLRRESKPLPIPHNVDTDKLNQEILTIKKKHTLFDIQNFSVICAPSVEMPVTINEIGRLREKTFREVGEGTNQSIDIDEYDLYYHQLFIWDNEKEQLVGAYRIGKGLEIIDQYGVNGFYIQSLFRINNKALPVLKQSLELGRSFIVSEYQKQPMPLFLLWKGILYFLLKNPEYRYLIGPVSISNQYSNISKSLIIQFLTKHFFHKELGQLFIPRNGY
jgi:hypothetical protein